MKPKDKTIIQVLLAAVLLATAGFMAPSLTAGSPSNGRCGGNTSMCCCDVTCQNCGNYSCDAGCASDTCCTAY